ncbi:hypothetical protein BU26DRAFT_13283 [Trematosphaeria pertusa]|uniref:Uncharacterized protein n=1 Tax=Trematosphaeria pertusa TaxID=390896 RepID=A0A6A6IZX6_9PLEO|nr:uncharacterized protein BU26DRAFT_13283 [Trematosphaeria pertusa]KAF2256014.1 hypothetical protein BU26DRAFT_13283 [Trematosphaeria pertusa]
MKLLPTLLFTLGVATASPIAEPAADAEALGLVSDGVTIQSRGCGTISATGSNVASMLQGDQQCHTLSKAIKNYKVGQGCTCMFFTAPSCDMGGDWPRWLVGPQQGQFSVDGTKSYTCGVSIAIA